MIYWQLFWEFFKIGLFTFGGGYAMIPLLKDAVLGHNWLSEERFYDFIGVTESTPGPIAVNMATYVGSTQAGIPGALIATFGVVLPSFIIILLVASILKNFLKNKYVQRFLEGLKPVVMGFILATGLLLVLKCFGYKSLTDFTFDLVSIKVLLLVVASYVFYRFFFHKKLGTVPLIIISAIWGILVSYASSVFA
jgi:chromate transporter